MLAFEVDLIHARWVGLRIVPATAPLLTSTFSGHAGRPDIASVLVQNHCNDLSFRVALEVELRVDNLVKELVLGVREDSEGGLPCSLRLEMIALEHDLQHAELGSVFAHVVAECSGVKRNFPELGWQFRHAQLAGRMVAILVQHESIDHAVAIASEGQPKSGMKPTASVSYCYSTSTGPFRDG
jgi:hypothetical protein